MIDVDIDYNEDTAFLFHRDVDLEFQASQLFEVAFGLRLNNPGNIRYNARNRWLGQTPPVNGFCSFSTLSYGMRALIILLFNYIRKGINTPSAIITRYAPPSENNTKRYIDYVVSQVGTDEPIVTLPRFCHLVIAICRMETGAVWSEGYIKSIISLHKISTPKSVK